MRRISRVMQTVGSGLAVAVLLGACVIPTVRAETAVAPSLVISQLKITSSNGQFVTLYNATNAALDMSKYQLEYFNSYDLSKATSSRLISLQGKLPPHSYYQINDSALLLCYQMTIDSVSLGFSSTAGYIAILGYNQVAPGGTVMPSTQDFVGWSKTAASGAQTLPLGTNAFLQRQPTDAQHNPAVSSPGIGSWLPVQPDGTNACALVTSSNTPSAAPTGLSQLLPSSEPPYTIVSIPPDGEVSTEPAGASVPAADIGMMAPKITELLPNPTGTGNDTTEEYIELYNPNPVAFDLTGFALQTGLNSVRNYKFSSGMSLAPLSFTAFYSEQTNLSLSNSAGQARLLDPLGDTISASEQYLSAKDGQAWALADGKWYYTANATPNAANIIKQPILAKMSKKHSSKQSTTAASKTSKPSKSSKSSKKLVAKSAKATKSKSAYAGADKPTTTPIHVWTLALVAGAAVLYGLYEYRTDMANRVHQLRSNFAGRGANR